MAFVWAETFSEQKLFPQDRLTKMPVIKARERRKLKQKLEQEGWNIFDIINGKLVKRNSKESN